MNLVESTENCMKLRRGSYLANPKKFLARWIGLTTKFFLRWNSFHVTLATRPKQYTIFVTREFRQPIKERNFYLNTLLKPITTKRT